MLRRVTVLVAVIALLSVAVAGAAWAANRIGNDRPNTLVGTTSSDDIYGPDADRLYAGAGVDELDGGKGPDTLRGGGDRDTLYGNFGRDDIRGGDGNDVVNGRDGIDSNDFVSGGPGTNDTCIADSDDEIDRTSCENF
jgi:serralysin